MDDVIISGGGPSGCMVGIILARAGVRVRILERSAFPRDKLCGDTLNPGALAALGRHLDLAPLRAVSIPLTGMRMTGPADAAGAGHYGCGEAGRAIVRRDLDAWLAREAVSAGASFEERQFVVGPRLRNGGVVGVEIGTSNGAASFLPAGLTIGADGRRSTLATALGLSQISPLRRWAVGAYFEEVDGVETMGEMHVRAGCYVGLAPVPGGAVNVCCVMRPASEPHLWRNPAAVIERCVSRDPRLAARFVHAKRVSTPRVLGPLAIDVASPGVPGLLLAGDAAGFIDPMTGDGLRFAFEGAELAAATALDVLRGGLSPEAAPAALAARRSARFGVKMRFDRTVRRLVESSTAVSAAAFAVKQLPMLLPRLIAYGGDCRLAALPGAHPAITPRRPHSRVAGSPSPSYPAPR